jgi:hypothetical protein
LWHQPATHNEPFGIVHFGSHVDMKKLAFGFWNHNANGMYWVLENGLADGNYHLVSHVPPRYQPLITPPELPVRVANPTGSFGAVYGCSKNGP